MNPGGFFAESIRELQFDVFAPSRVHSSHNNQHPTIDTLTLPATCMLPRFRQCPCTVVAWPSSVRPL